MRTKFLVRRYYPPIQYSTYGSPNLRQNHIEHFSDGTSTVCLTSFTLTEQKREVWGF